MLTLFAIPKAFEGESARIQRNALRSWTRFGSDAQVLLVGDDPGVAEAAAEFGAEHVPDVGVNEYGTPLLDSAFALAESRARHPVMAYTNADLIFPPTTVEAVAAVSSAVPRFMIVGRCYDLEVPYDLDPSGLDGLMFRDDGELRGYDWIDYFVFPRGVLGALPPFAVGRPWWDTWMIWRARKLRLTLVDGTEDVRVIHQRHGYAHVRASSGYRWFGPEGDANHAHLRLGQSLSIEDATHALRDGKVQRIHQPIRRRVRTTLFMYDSAIPLYRFGRWLYQPVKRFRH